MKIFIDTSAFIALFVTKEVDHTKVVKKYQEYKQQHALLFTSYYIFDELFTRLLYDFGKQVAAAKIEELLLATRRKELHVLSIDEAIFQKTTKIFIKFADHNVSFTDATSYVLFKEFKLDEIFTLDSDFRKIQARTSF